MLISELQIILQELISSNLLESQITSILTPIVDEIHKAGSNYWKLFFARHGWNAEKSTFDTAIDLHALSHDLMAVYHTVTWPLPR